MPDTIEQTPLPTQPPALLGPPVTSDAVSNSSTSNAVGASGPTLSAITVAVRVRPFSAKELALMAPEPSRLGFLSAAALTSNGGASTVGGGYSTSNSGSGGGRMRKVVHVLNENVLVFDPSDETNGGNNSSSNNNNNANGGMEDMDDDIGMDDDGGGGGGGRQRSALSRNFAFRTRMLAAKTAQASRPAKDVRYVFDRVFGEDSTQADIYSSTTRPLIDAVLQGFNATVFAYGATGCGKTYTISGTRNDPGIIFRTMEELFSRMDELSHERTVEASLSYLEVYNETIRDLLGPDADRLSSNMSIDPEDHDDNNEQNVPLFTSASLALREGSARGVTVAGLTEHHPTTVEQVMRLVMFGNRNRTQSPTEANATSSRSHAVLQINIKQKPRGGGLSTDVIMATFSIIDLAGSERASVTKNRGERLLEGANINRSLLALANCINALCDSKKHIPYRDSKLTRLLKFSLGGNCKTAMIVCVSPASTYYDETHNTLKYANRAKNIKTRVEKNTVNVKAHLTQYRKQISDQADEIRRLQQENANLRRQVSELRAQASNNSHGPTRAANGANNNSSSAEAVATLPGVSPAYNIVVKQVFTAQDSANTRKHVQAIQVVEDIRNKLANSYASIRSIEWEHASISTVGRLFAHQAEALISWKDAFNSAVGGGGQSSGTNSNGGSFEGIDGDHSIFSESGLVSFLQQSPSSTAQGTDSATASYLRTVESLIDDITRHGRTLNRQLDNSYNSLVRHRMLAARHAGDDKSAQPSTTANSNSNSSNNNNNNNNPTKDLTADQKYRVEMERKVLELGCRAVRLERALEITRAEVGAHHAVSGSLMRLNAMCLGLRQHVINQLNEMDSSSNDSPAVQYLQGLYMAAIESFADTTKVITGTVQNIRAAGGPGKWQLEANPIPIPDQSATRGMVVAMFDGFDGAALTNSPAPIGRTRAATVSALSASSMPSSMTVSSAVNASGTGLTSKLSETLDPVPSMLSLTSLLNPTTTSSFAISGKVRRQPSFAPVPTVLSPRGRQSMYIGSTSAAATAAAASASGSRPSHRNTLNGTGSSPRRSAILNNATRRGTSTASVVSPRVPRRIGASVLGSASGAAPRGILSAAIHARRGTVDGTAATSATASSQAGSMGSGGGGGFASAQLSKPVIPRNPSGAPLPPLQTLKRVRSNGESMQPGAAGNRKEVVWVDSPPRRVKLDDGTAAPGPDGSRHAGNHDENDSEYMDISDSEMSDVSVSSSTNQADAAAAEAAAPSPRHVPPPMNAIPSRSILKGASRGRNSEMTSRILGGYGASSPRRRSIGERRRSINNAIRRQNMSRPPPGQQQHQQQQNAATARGHLGLSAVSSTSSSSVPGRLASSNMSSRVPSSSQPGMRPWK